MNRPLLKYGISNYTSGESLEQRLFKVLDNIKDLCERLEKRVSILEKKETVEKERISRCPFCGGEPIEVKSNEATDNVCIQCMNCNMRGPSFPSADNAIVVWNSFAVCDTSK